jgi:hypothetical protein
MGGMHRKQKYSNAGYDYDYTLQKKMSIVAHGCESYAVGKKNWKRRQPCMEMSVSMPCSTSASGRSWCPSIPSAVWDWVVYVPSEVMVIAIIPGAMDKCRCQL